MKTSLMAARALLLLTAGTAVCAGAFAASPQGDTWDSIKQLPNWSGIFALDRVGHETAGRDSSPEDGGAVPLTPAWHKLRDESTQGKGQPSLAFCLPAGVPGVMLHTLLTEWLFTPGRVTILVEDGEVRRIYTDRKTHLPVDQLSSSYEGDSIGHWEGKTLVVDTVGFPKGELFANGGLKAHKNTRYVERIFLRDKDHLEIDSSLEDPEVFTKPYTKTRIYEREDDPQMPEPMCAQSARDHGNEVDLTPPPAD
jgi:hypothetical protein